MKVVGHKEQIKKMQQAYLSGRLAPVLLFLGPSGIGKRQVALNLAQFILCDSLNPPCGTCGNCIRASKGSHESITLLEPQGASIKVEQTRELISKLSLRNISKARLVIINEAEKLNPQSANSLLKTLEEPPPNTYFILIANSQAAILPTLRSRSQIVRFGSLSLDELAQVVSAPDWVLASSQGQVTRAQSFALSDFVEKRKKVLEIFCAVKEGSQKRSWATSQLKEIMEDREQALEVVGLWQQFVRDLYVVATNANSALIHQDRAQEIKSLLPASSEKMEQIANLAIQAEKDLNGNIDRNTVFENLWQQTAKALS